MIRVVHVTNQLETGGMERLLVEFARHADRSRFELEFVCLGGRGPIGAVIESMGWPVRALGMRPGVRPSALLALSREFVESRCDVVHTHNTKPLLYSAPAAKIAGVEGLIHTRHGQRIGTTARQDWAFGLASRAADRVVCVSRATFRASVDEGLSRDTLCTIENGIDVERFAFAGPRLGGVAMYVGRLSPEKGVDVLLHATKQVLEHEPEFRLRIAGSGPSMAGLRDLAGSLGVASRVEFLGDVSEVGALLREASMLVLPSRSEGLSIAILEGMSVGLPVVATRVGGTPEAVEDGATGVLVEPDDAEGLAAQLLSVWRDPALAARLGRAGRARVESRFDVRAMVARYEAIYAEVCGVRGAVAA